MSEHTPRDEEAVARFVERFALSLADLGMGRMTARVFVTLLTADEGRRTAGELAEQLRVSPAAISGAVRQLADLGLVTRERDPGQRRDHYRVEDDSWYSTITRQDAMLLRLIRELSDGVDLLGRNSPAARRLDETRRFFDFLHQGVADLLNRWENVRDSPEHA